MGGETFRSITSYTKKMERFLNLFIFTDTLHVSSGFSAHYQEHITVHATSGIGNQYCCYNGSSSIG
jgi:hypothetical protein